MTAAPTSEACYCGTRWRHLANGIRYCPHCDQPPLVRYVAAIVDGVEHYGYRCPLNCGPCGTVGRRRWDL